MRRPHAHLLLLGTLTACGNGDGELASHVDASCWGPFCPTYTADGGIFVAPVVRVDLPACPASDIVTLPANTDPAAAVDVHLSGPCVRLCSLVPTTPCDDAGVSWSTQTLCTCLNGAPWTCTSSSPRVRSSCGAPTFACPGGPVLFSGGAAALLPHGRCNANDGCTLRARERCSDGTSGITTAYGCGCPQTDAGFGRWDCTTEWATTIGCDGAVSEAGAALPVDAGGYGIEVEGDGAPFTMTDGLNFNDVCGMDVTLSGCLAAGTAPCITAGVNPGSGGRYTDRQGNYWTLTSSSITGTDDGGGIGNGGIANGILIVTAVGEDGGTMQLVLRFHTPYMGFVCRADERARDYGPTGQMTERV